MAKLELFLMTIACLAVFCLSAAADSVFLCDFEEDNCGLVPAANNSFDWIRYVSEDDPYLPAGGYMLADSTDRSPGDTAGIKTQKIDSSGKHCVTFDYRELGSEPALLGMYYALSGRRSVALWRRQETSPLHWATASVEIDVPDAFSLEWEVIVDGVDSVILLDNIEVEDGACPTPPLSCNFDFSSESTGGCSSYQTSTSSAPKSFAFYRYRGSYLKESAVDHTTMTEQGYFLMANFSDAQSPNELTKFGGPVIPAGDNVHYCLTFWYQLITKDFVSFGLTTNSSEALNQFQHAGDDTSAWMFASAKYKSSTTAQQIIFEITSGLNRKGFLKVDDIVLQSNVTCSVYATCDFETDTCGWRNEGSMNWAFYSLHPGEEGPPTQTHLIFVSHEDSKPGMQAVLASPYVSTRNCFKFWFKILRSAPASLEVTERLVVPGGSQTTNKTIWSIPTDWKIGYWSEGQVSISMKAYNDLEISFVVTRLAGEWGSSYDQAMVSIDDVSVTLTNDCPFLPSSNSSSTGATSPAPASTEVPSATGCDFTNGNLCSWKRYSSADEQEREGSRWEVVSDVTNSYFIDPPQDDHGHWLAFRPSSVGFVDVATFTSPVFPANESSCVTFDYYMNGADVLALEVLVEEDGNKSLVWRRDGFQSDGWLPGSIFIFANKHKIIFRTATGGRVWLYVAIDNIVITPGSCEAAVSNIESGSTCSFEENSCAISQDCENEPEAKWTAQSGPRPDHTTQTDYGKAFWLMGSDEKEVSCTARLTFTSKQESCLTFFHLTDCEAGGAILEVGTETVNGVAGQKSMLSGTNGHWRAFQVTVPANGGAEGDQVFVLLKGSLPSTSACSMALDDMTTATGPCPSNAATCDFEDHTSCLWSSDSRLVNWFVSTSAVHINGPADQADFGSRYLLFEPGPYHRPYTKVRLVSPSLVVPENTTTFCFMFYYTSYGYEAGEVEVRLVHEENLTSQDAWKHELRSLVDWTRATVNFKVEHHHYVVELEGIIGKGQEGSFAIDNLEVRYEDCPSEYFFEEKVPTHTWNGEVMLSTVPEKETWSAHDSDRSDDLIHLCTFESSNSNCSIEFFSSVNNYTWHQVKASQVLSPFRPQVDGDFSVEQHYITSPDYYGDLPNIVAGFRTPTLKGGVDYCMSFLIHYTGLKPPLFYFQMRGGESGEDLVQIYRRVAPQADEWISESRTLKGMNFEDMFNLDAIAIITNTTDGDASIDNFRIDEGPCQEPTDACHFYEGFCSLVQADDDDIDWQWHDGHGMGDVFIAVQSVRHDYFIYLDTKASPGSRARLYTPYMNITQPQCLSVSVLLHGTAGVPGSISVWQEEEATSRRRLLRLVDSDQGVEWKIHHIAVLESASAIRLVFEGVLSELYQPLAAMGLDEIRLTEGPCWSELSCTWEEPGCGWTGDVLEPGYLWQRAARSQVSLWTRPVVDHTLRNQDGSFVFAAARQTFKNDEVNHDLLYSPLMPALGETVLCVSFWYHMYGCDECVLYLHQKDHSSAQMSELLQIRDDVRYDTGWHSAKASLLPSSSLFQLVLLVETGFNSMGDVSVDDFLLNSGNCDRTSKEENYDLPPGDLSCDFNNGTFCAWTPVAITEGFYWKVGNSETTTHPLPAADFSDSGNGLYAYADVYESTEYSSKTQLNATSSPTIASCLTFHYFVEGDHELYVTIDETYVWRTNSPEPQWRYAQVNVVSETPYVVAFVSVHGRSALGAVALDNVALKSGQCSEKKDSCDFESGNICGWKLTPAVNATDLTWEWRQLEEEYYFFDHTSNSNFGHVLFVYNNKDSANKEAIAQSSTITLSGWSCVRWWYVAYPKTRALLTVSVVPTNATGYALRESAELVWHTWDVLTQWNEGAVTMTAEHFKLEFGASFLTADNTTGLAIDDVSVHKGHCGIPGDCRFTHSSLCGWEVHEEGSSFWLVQHGDDRSFGDDYYLRLAGEEAAVESPVISQDLLMNLCLTFWYRAEQAATLEWFVQKVDAQEKEPIWTSVEETPTSGWMFGRTYVSYNFSHSAARLVLWGTTQAYWEDGVVGVDDIQLNVGVCSIVPDRADPNIPTSSTTTSTTYTPEPGSNSSSLNDCAFEEFTHPLCNWNNQEFAQCYWEWSEAPLLSATPGPSVDHTSSSSRGHFASVESTSEGNSSECVLYDQYQFPTDAACFSFWYYMYGVSVQNLSAVAGNSSSESDPPKFVRSGSQGDFWHFARVTFRPSQNYQRIMLITYRTSENTGIVAVDDLKLADGECYENPTDPSEVHDFEQDRSSFTIVAGGTQDWVLNSTGGLADHTLGTVDGHFALWKVESSSAAVSGAILSPAYSALGDDVPHCMHFYYMLDTPSVNTTLVGYCMLSESEASSGVRAGEEKIFTNKISQGPNWIYQEATLHSKCSLQVKIEANDDHSPSTTIGIDDIHFTEGVCTDTFSCDFEHDLCFWTNGFSSSSTVPVEEQSEWLVASPNNADFIGPSLDVTIETASGHYVILSGSFISNSTVGKAELVSKEFPPTGINDNCLVFHYFMRGDSYLEVRVKQYMMPSYTAWRLEADSGDNTGWVRASASLLGHDSFQIHLVASVTRDRDTFVAVDDLQFKFEPCTAEPPQASVVVQAVEDLTCDFVSDTCSWMIDPEDTVTVGESDAVSGLSDTRGTYAFMTSYNQTSRASLSSPMLGPNLEYPNSFCFSFWYYNFGVTAPSIAVYMTAVDTGEEELKFSRAATKVDVWHHSYLELPTSSDWELSVKMISEHLEVTGVAAIDDTSATVGNCKLPEGDCDVEVDMCRWYNLEGAGLRWQRASPIDTLEGGTPVIDHDHTTGSAYGHYFAVQSAPTQLQQTKATELKAQLAGPLILSAISEQCVIFWYYIDAESNSSLSVVREVVDAQNSSVQWSVQGFQARSWVVARVPIDTANVEIRIIFEAQVFNNNTYAVLLDDILILEESCPESELSCTFEHSCGYFAGNSFDNPWLIGRGVTERPQYVAGPTEDHTFSNGMYAYVDFTSKATNAVNGSLKANLASELQEPSDGCLSFYWVKYMNSSGDAAAPTLAAYLVLWPSNTAIELVTLGGQNVSTTWTEQRVTFSSQGSEFRLVFSATAYDQGSFVGIDDTFVWSGACEELPTPAPAAFPGSCDFESEDLCGFQDEDIVYPWKVGSRANLSVLPLDHSSGSDTGKVLYRQSEGNENERASIVSEPVLIPQACVSFYFYNSPPNALKLQVYKKMSHHSDELIGDISTPLENWLALRYYVEENEEWQLKLVVESFLDEGAVVVVDDITISESPCEVRATCDFEETNCLWEPSAPAMWTRGVIRDDSSLEPGYPYSPSHDHSTGTEFGSYLFFYDRTNSSVADDTVSSIYSETIPSGGQRCFEAWVFLNGDNVGELSLNFLYADGSTSVAQSIDPDLNIDQWRMVQIEDHTSMHWLYFEARGSGGPVDILAVDDTALRDGNCSMSSKIFVCESGKEVARDKVCDYYSDCELQDDEAVCAPCSFALDMCGWQSFETAVSPSMFYWQFRSLEVSSEGTMTATRTESSSFEEYDAHLFTPETQHATYFTCYMELKFRLFGTNESDPRLIVRMQNDGASDWTHLFEANGLSQSWQLAVIPVGTVADRFILSLTFEPRPATSSAEGLGAEIGDIQLLDCGLFLEPLKNCDEGQNFRCDNNQTCVPSFAVCDYNHDCVDGADEEACDSGHCSFENHYEECEWQTKGFVAVVASQSPALLYRDHSVNQGSGSFLIDDGSAEYPMVYSYTVNPSEDCEFGFYSSVSGNLNVKVVIDVVDLDTEEVIHSAEVVAATRRNLGWQRTVQRFSYDGATQIRVIGINKWSEGFIALDDFFMTSKCDLTSTGGDPVSYYPEAGICNGDEFECENKTCIHYTKVCDFTRDCSEGEDESRCGTTDLSTSTAGWQDWSVSSYRWERASAEEAQALGGSPPPHAHLNSDDQHYFWLFGGYAGSAQSHASLVSPEMGPTALTCKLSFYMYARNLIPFILVQVETAGSVLETPVNEFIFAVQTDQWELKEVHIGEFSERVRVRMTAKKESYRTENAVIDLFLDDISFDGCSSEEPAVNGSFDCHFSSPCADLYQGLDDNANWIDQLDLFTLNHHLTLSSSPSKIFEADLLTWYRTHSSQFCFSFRYKIQGGASLFILISDKGGRNETMWMREHEVDFVDWQRVHLEFGSPDNDFQLKMRGRTEGTNDLEQFVWLDDVELRFGLCPAELTCTFDDGDCGWHNDTVPEQLIPWLVVSADTNTSVYAPSMDHSWMTAAGQYAMIDVQAGQTGMNGRLRSSENTPTSAAGDCFKFWYFVFSAEGEISVGELAVLLDTGDSFDELWSNGQEEWDSWQLGQTTIKSTVNFSLVIQATRSESEVGTMAVDDLTIEFGPCTNEVDCDFEGGICGWTQDGSDDIFWDLFEAQSGPHEVHVDHTINSELGHYIAFDSQVCDETEPADCSANLYSVYVHPEASEYCFSGYVYASNLDANDTMTLTVRLLVDNSSNTMSPLPVSAGGQQAWVPFSQNITGTKSTFQITLRAFALSSIGEMFIMLDDLLLTHDFCGSEITTTVAATTLPPFNDVFSCDFEEGDTCQWTVDDMWFLADGENEVLQPWGPFSDHTTDLSSGHMLVVTGIVGSSIENVEVYSPFTTVATDGVCFSFYYYIHGDADIFLSLVVSEGENENYLAWQHEGEKDNQWHQTYYYVAYETANSKVQFSFSAGYITADNRTGNIAVDDVVAHAGECAERDFCDFEALDVCGWQMPEGDGTVRWLQAEGKDSASSPDIPPTDHTYGNEHGHLTYVSHASSNEATDPLCAIYSPAITAPDQRIICLELYYIMQGPAGWAGRLSVHVKPPYESIEDSTPIWSTSGSRGANWVRFFIETDVEETFQIAMVAFDNDTSSSTIIALDDVSWKEGSCPELGTCDFEAGTCGFTNDQISDDYDWVVWRGDASSHETGPNVDHTLDTEKGHYMLLDASVGTLGDQAILLLTDIPPGTYCFKFYYFMYGEDVGGLTVNVKDNKTIFTIFKKTSHTGDQWNLAVTEAHTDEYFSLVVIGTVGEGPLGDIAIDDTSLEIGECYENPNEYHCHDGSSIPFDNECDFIEDCSRGEDESLCADCHFENSFCGWSRDESTNHIWALGEMSPTFSKSLYVAERVSGEPGPALLHTKDLHHAFLTCTFKFWYRCNPVNGTSARLSVSVATTGEVAYVYHIIDEGNDEWKEAAVEILDYVDVFRLILEGETNAARSALTVDDASVESCAIPTDNRTCETRQFSCTQTGLCVDEIYLCDGTNDCGDLSDEENCLLNDPMCDFEEDDSCSWKQENARDDIDWMVNSGQTPAGLTSFKTGPSTDHTTRRTEGRYFYITQVDSSERSYKISKAWLVSPDVEKNEEKDCVLRFHYYMYGANVQGLSVYSIPLDGGETTTLFGIAGYQGQKWIRIAVNATYLGRFQFVIEGLTADLNFVDIAIDDISLSEGCKVYNETHTGSTVHSTVPPSSTTPTRTSTKTTKPTTPYTKPPSTSPKPQTTTVKGCPASTINCGDQNTTCVPGMLVCDSISDCPNGFDEQNCIAGAPCNPGFLYCGSETNTCVNRSEVLCDGTVQCPLYEADESICGECLSYFCLNGGTCQVDQTTTAPVCSCTSSRYGNRCELEHESSGGLSGGAIAGIVIAVLLLVAVLVLLAYSQRYRFDCLNDPTSNNYLSASNLTQRSEAADDAAYVGPDLHLHQLGDATDGGEDEPSRSSGPTPSLAHPMTSSVHYVVSNPSADKLFKKKHPPAKFYGNEAFESEDHVNRSDVVSSSFYNISLSEM